MASLATTVAAVGALWFSGQSLRANENQYKLSEQGLLTERFSKAIEQLGSSTLDVRLGAVYSLERLSRDSIPDHPTIFEILGAFIRTHAPVTPECTESPAPLTEPRPPVDVQAALTAIGRRDAAHDGANAIDLSSSCLAGASLTDADLYGADLTESVLAYADLRGTDFTDAHLTGVDLYGADLTGATLIGIEFHDADLTDIVYDDSTTWSEGAAPLPPTSPR
ncbi:pentapeptide repeat-containing protein [Rhodococcus sp. B50]|uniref:pentapeptide repeat-containing protein n=1 Tax=Rhodococcus sp. B50 TaxID=2682847 RepID=UPI001BD57DC8|nr:pentapeptide repeat-containing protein [Rhodococcus sp. B50]MBS9372437.1 Pentapeptide repeat protein Rfr32 [Rhodococcus sp. B50]